MKERGRKREREIEKVGVCFSGKEGWIKWEKEYKMRDRETNKERERQRRI